MNVDDFEALPTVQAIAIKHDFGDGRYVTLMVTKYPQHVVASLFGTEHGQVDFKAADMRSGRNILEAEFGQLFPAHACVDGCHKTWHPFSDLADSDRVH